VKIKPHSNGTRMAVDVPRAVNRSNIHLSRPCKSLNFLASRIMCAIVYSYERRPSGPTDVLLNLSKFAISKDRIFFDNRLFTE